MLILFRTAPPLAALLCLSLSAFLPVPAAQARDAAEVLRMKVDMAGRQRMLSQRMASAACFLDMGIDRDTHELALTEAVEIFDVSLRTLGQGDAVTDLPASSDPAVLQALAQTQQVWAPIKPLAEQILTGTADPGAVAEIASQEDNLLQAAQKVVVAFTADMHVPPHQADLARAIDMAGRQRMLSQSIVKNACLITYGQTRGMDTAPYHAQMLQRMALFEKSATLLRNGDTTEGIAAPPTSDVEEALDTVLWTWQELYETLAAPIDGKPLNLDGLEEASQEYEQMLRQLEDVVWYYVHAS